MGQTTALRVACAELKLSGVFFIYFLFFFYFYLYYFLGGVWFSSPPSILVRRGRVVRAARLGCR